MPNIQEQFGGLREAVGTAAVCFDVWWVLQDPAYKGVRIKYPSFFGPTASAHLISFVVALYRLFEKRHDTVSFSSLLKEIDRSGSNVSDEFKAKIEQLKPIWVKISTLRNEVYAHKSAELDYDVSFQKANITPAEIRNFIEESKALLNDLKVRIFSEEYVYSTNSQEDTVRLLEDLTRFSNQS